jgi:uncharacterized protein with NRDE domain
MCLIAWNWQPHSDTPLLLLSNRDEFYARPAQPLHWWEHAEGEREILAGKDLQSGGTWLGVSRSGRLGALTNYRTPEPVRTNTPTRGELVTQFLQDNISAEQFLGQLAQYVSNYNPFNLLLYDGRQFMGLESHTARILTLEPGIGAVSNANFHTPWPKLTRLSQGLKSQVKQGRVNTPELLHLLHDRHTVIDADLPQTGVPLPLERMLSSIFIASPTYGTRACSVVSVHTAHIDFTEQGFDEHGLLGQSQQRLVRA